MRIVCVALGLLISTTVFAEHTVVLAKFARQYYLGVTPDCPQPEGEDYTNICLDTWVGFEVSPIETLVGLPTPKRIRIARVQHTIYNDKAFRSLQRREVLLVLRLITDPATRKKLKSDYYWVESSEPEGMYCLHNDPSSYGLGDKVTNIIIDPRSDNERHCFNIKQ
jgi:hypothetical protein